MQNTIVFFRLFLLIILLLPNLSGCHHGCQTPGVPNRKDPGLARGETPLVIGTLAVYFEEIRAVYRPLVELLQEELDTPVSFEMKSEPDAMSRALADGEIQLYLDSPLPALRVCRHSGANPAFAIEKGRRTRFFSIIFCRKDSGISSLADLKGRSFVFASNESTSGYGLPRTTLRRAGLIIEENPDAASDENVHALFSGDGESTMFWVLDGRGDAGAVSNEYFLMLSGPRRNELQVLARTDSTPAGLICFSPEMPAAQRDTLSRLLTRLGSDPETSKKLEAFHGVTGFVPLSEGQILKIENALGMDNDTR